MTTAKTPDHKKMTLPQLQEAHSDMLATADDLGFKVPEELCSHPETVEAGVPICDKLHDAISKFSAGLDKSDEESADKKGLATETEAVQGAPSTKTGQKPAKKPAKASKAKPGASTEATSTAQPAPAAKAKEKTMAKKAKKAPAKKAAKKASAPKKTSGAHALKSEGVITVKTKDGENPCRKGSEKFNRVAAIFKLAGKTVEEAVKKGVKKGSLNHCVEQGWIAIK